MNKGKIIRFTFSRGDDVKYVSHLDFVRMVERSIRRANLPIAYSCGFNPRQLLVFGMPLPVGMTSDCELMDGEFETEVDPEEVIEKLNNTLPGNVKFISAEVLTKPNVNIPMAKSRAAFSVKCVSENNNGAKALEKAREIFAGNEPFIVIKRSKSGEKPTDIRPMIHELSGEIKDNDLIEFSMKLDCGGNSNLRPDLVVKAISNISESSLRILSARKVSAE